MSWGRQVWYVFRGDVAERRVQLGVYLLSLIAAVLPVAGVAVPDLGGAIAFLLPFFLVGVLADLIASDPPAGVPRFWSIQPLNRSAVGMAKVLFVLMLPLAGVLARAVLLRAWQVDWPEITRLCATRMFEISALLLAVACLASVIAIADGRARGFAWATTSLLVAFFLALIAAGLVSRALSIIGQLPAFTSVISCACLTYLLMRSYRHRDRPQQETIATMGMSVVLLGATLTASNPPAVSTSNRHVADTAVPVTLLSFEDDRGVLNARILTRAGVLHRVTSQRVEVVRRDGGTQRDSVHSTWLHSSLFAELGERRAAIVPGTRFVRDSFLTPVTAAQRDSASWFVYSTPSRRRSNPIASARFTGTLETFHLTEFARIPLRERREVRGPGWKASVISRHVAADSGGVAYTLALAALAGTDAHRVLGFTGTLGNESPRILLLTNRRDGAVVPLTSPSSSSSTEVGGYFSFGVATAEIQLVRSDLGMPRPGIDAAWLADADLVILRARLVSRAPFSSEYHAP